MFRPSYGPDYRLPFYVSLALNIFAFIGYAFNRFFLLYTNKKRAAKLATMSEREIQEEKTNDVRLGDKKLTFVYST